MIKKPMKFQAIQYFIVCLNLRRKEAFCFNSSYFSPVLFKAAGVFVNFHSKTHFVGKVLLSRRNDVIERFLFF